MTSFSMLLKLNVRFSINGHYLLHSKLFLQNFPSILSTVIVNIVVPDVTQIMKPVICFYIFVLYIANILIVGVSYLNLVEEQNPTYGWLICTALLLQNKRTTFIQMSFVFSEKNLESVIMWTCFCGDKPTTNINYGIFINLKH